MYVCMYVCSFVIPNMLSNRFWCWSFLALVIMDKFGYSLVSLMMALLVDFMSSRVSTQALADLHVCMYVCIYVC